MTGVYETRIDIQSSSGFQILTSGFWIRLLLMILEEFGEMYKIWYSKISRVHAKLHEVFAQIFIFDARG